MRDACGTLLTSIFNVDRTRFPLFQHATPFEVVQERGETIVVPSRWFHQVVNEALTLSINHNWGWSLGLSRLLESFSCPSHHSVTRLPVNACNVDMMLEALLEDLQRAEKEIQDCRSMPGWHEQCQILLKVGLAGNGTGLNHFIFFCAALTLFGPCTC